MVVCKRIVAKNLYKRLIGKSYSTNRTLLIKYTLTANLDRQKIESKMMMREDNKLAIHKYCKEYIHFGLFLLLYILL